MIFMKIGLLLAMQRNKSSFLYVIFIKIQTVFCPSFALHLKKGMKIFLQTSGFDHIPYIWRLYFKN
jgi:hypothetical protein